MAESRRVDRRMKRVVAAYQAVFRPPVPKTVFALSGGGVSAPVQPFRKVWAVVRAKRALCKRCGSVALAGTSSATMDGGCSGVGTGDSGCGEGILGAGKGVRTFCWDRFRHGRVG